MSHAACTSRRVLPTIWNVLAGPAGCAGFACPGGGRPGTSSTRGFERGHADGTTPPLIQARTERAAQSEKSAVTVLWPTPGTTSSFPCGNWATTLAALAVGVRMSKPPLTASIGTSGSGPAPSGAPPAGLGQFRQKSALPKRAAQLPKGPRDPAGNAAMAACSIAARSAGGVLGSHGNGPSWQSVAA